MTPYQQKVEFQDELLADQTVSRVYSNDRREWRTKLADGRVEWRDDTGASGVDELLGDRIVKRTVRGGEVIYGREQGFGRTLWSNDLLTVNRTDFGGRIGGILAAVTGAALIGGLVAPPIALSAEQEEALRQQQQRAQQSSGGGDAGGSSSDTNTEWSDGSDANDSDSDFG